MVPASEAEPHNLKRLSDGATCSPSPIQAPELQISIKGKGHPHPPPHPTPSLIAHLSSVDLQSTGQLQKVSIYCTLQPLLALHSAPTAPLPFVDVQEFRACFGEREQAAMLLIIPAGCTVWSVFRASPIHCSCSENGSCFQEDAMHQDVKRWNGLFLFTKMSSGDL